MPVYSRGKDRFDMWFSDSPDLCYRGNSHLVARVEQFPFANDKIGPAAPPIKTSKGWLTTIHRIDRDPRQARLGGCLEETLHRRDCPARSARALEMIGRCPTPLIAPEVDYEQNGFRNDVIFPGGMILEDDGEVKIYYGAADACEAPATAQVDELLALCISGRVRKGWCWCEGGSGIGLVARLE